MLIVTQTVIEASTFTFTASVKREADYYKVEVEYDNFKPSIFRLVGEPHFIEYHILLSEALAVLGEYASIAKSNKVLSTMAMMHYLGDIEANELATYHRILELNWIKQELVLINRTEDKDGYTHCAYTFEEYDLEVVYYDCDVSYCLKLGEVELVSATFGCEGNTFSSPEEFTYEYFVAE